MVEKDVKLKKHERIARDLGFKSFKEAVKSYRLKGVSNIEIRDKFCMTTGTYDRLLQANGLTNIKIKPEDMDLFEYVDSLMTNKKRKKVFPIVKKLGFSSITRCIYHLSKEMEQKDVGIKINCSPSFISSKLKSVELEKKYRSGEKERPIAKERGPVVLSKLSKKKNDKELCTCCGVRKRSGRFLCDYCFVNGESTGMDNPGHAGGYGRMG